MNNNFLSFKNWLFEKEITKNNPQYGCVMLEATIPDWEENHINCIDEDDIYTKPSDNSYGLEEEPHITILYGIHEDEVDPEVITSVIENNLYPVEIPISEIDIFENEEYDVVKYTVPLTDDLKKFRKLFLTNFPNTQKFPDYNPHITIAYVLPGTGKKYKNKLSKPFNVTFSKAIYSYHENEEDTEELTKKVINLENEEISESLKNNIVKGGKGDKLKISDVCPKQLAIGKEVEMEHSSSRKIASEIALDHLAEDPKYYSKLIEKGFVDEEPAIKRYIKYFGKKKLPNKYKNKDS